MNAMQAFIKQFFGKNADTICMCDHIFDVPGFSHVLNIFCLDLHREFLSVFVILAH